ncbi:MAG: PD40 domain-containing protein [Planctomycetaceae bacterium]|nr:PD40 domain-containing protein [Planctomycetaceae bacterium]
MLTSLRTLHCGMLVLGAALVASPASAASTERVSVTSAEQQATNNTPGPVAFGSYSTFRAISADGRFVVFGSYATNLVTPDANGGEVADTFVRDRLLGTTRRVNVSTAGVQGTLDGSWPLISANGRFVVFNSYSKNLVPGDDPTPIVQEADVFLRDLQAGTTERVSVNIAGVEGDNDSQHPASISADGRYVAFPSYSTDLVNGDSNGKIDVFVRDRTAGTTERVSVNSAEVQGNGHSDIAAISPDGRFVAFSSSATDLVANDTNGKADVFVRDRLNGTTVRVSLSLPAGTQPNGDSIVTAISAGGRLVAFSSHATNLVANDTNGKADVFIRDRVGGTTERVSVSSSEGEGDGDSANPSLSADGRLVSFSSYATNLVPNDTNNFIDVFVRDRLTGTTERVNVSSAGVQANHPPSVYIPPGAGISANGRFVAFTSDGTNLVPNDNNGLDDIFVRDRGRVQERNNDLLIDFAANGLHQRMNNATWVKVHNSSPLGVASGDLDGSFKDEAIASFAGLGLFARYNNAGVFKKLHNTAATRFLAADLDGDGRDEIVADFGASGIFARYNNAGAFVRLHSSTSQGLAVGDLDANGSDDLLLDLSTGLWVSRNNVNPWVRLHATSPTVIATGNLDGKGGDEVIGVFPGLGVLARYNDAGVWVKLHGSTAQGLVAGDFDGDGKDDLVVDLGASGLSVRYNNAAPWVRRHASNPIRILTTDLDNNGKAEVIASFTGTGLWVRRNNADPWVQLRSWAEQGVAAGGFD